MQMAFSYCESVWMKTGDEQDSVTPAVLWRLRLFGPRCSYTACWHGSKDKQQAHIRPPGPLKDLPGPQGSEDKHWEPLAESTDSSLTAWGGSAPSLK